MSTVLRVSRSAALLLMLGPVLGATTVPRVTFEQLTDASEIIASGNITQSRTGWDSEHKYIWTHYTLSVTDTVKGARVSTGVYTVEFAEPGGIVGNASMLIAGSVRYAIGESVLVFLARMPNGYLRTTGWSQGRYALDSNGRLHASALIAASSLKSLDGMAIGELKQKVADRIRTPR